MKRLIFSVILIFMIITISGCASHQHAVNLQKSFVPKEDTKVKVAEISNKTGFNYEINIEQLLKSAFVKQLKTNNLLADENSKNIIILNVDIMKYSEGSAFKRWLMPGWGKTELTITAKLYSNNQEIGTLKATREIIAGGGYTIGAWEYVFNDLAEDVIEDFKKEFQKQHKL